MKFLVVLVVDDPEDFPTILDAWENLGVTGITILESLGLGRLRRAGLEEDFPLMPSIRDLFESGEIHHRTVFSVVEGQEMVDSMVAAVHNITGDLDLPHSGFMFVVPVAQVYGLHRRAL